MDFSHIDLSVFNKNTFVECYGKTIYESSTCIFKDETTLEYKYPGLALFDYLTQNKKLKFNNFVIFGTSSSYWFNLALNFKDFFNRKNIKFPYADQIVGEKIPKDAPIPEGAIYGNTICSKDDITKIENEINKILQKKFNCTFKIIIHSDDVSTLESQTDIIKKLYENKEIFQDQHIYFDITCGMRFVPLLLLSGLNCLQISSDVKIENIFYAQQYKKDTHYENYIREMKFIDRMFKEAHVYQLHQDLNSLKPIASIIDQDDLKDAILNINRLINLQSYDLALDLYKETLPKLKDYFKTSSIFKPEVFDQNYNLLKNPQELVRKYFASNNFFNMLSLMKNLNLKIKNPQKFKTEFRDPIFHYANINKEHPLENYKAYKDDLVMFLKQQGFNLSPSIAQPLNSDSKTLFSFLGSGNYYNIHYYLSKDNVILSRFLGNSLAYKLSKENKINKYILCGTYTSGWKVFIDTLLELYAQENNELQEIKDLFYKYKVTSINEKQQEIESIILNKKAVIDINQIFKKYRDLFGMLIQIHAYDEKLEYKDDFKNLTKFIADNVKYGQEFYLDITHSFRDIPIISLLTAYALKIIKKANLIKLYYGYMDPAIKDQFDDGNKSGYLIDLAYLLSVFDDAKNISSFGISANLQYLVPTIEKFYPSNATLIENLTNASLYESSMIFDKSIEFYQKAYDEIQNSPIDDPIFKLFEPQLKSLLVNYRWDDRASGFVSRATFYTNNDFYTHAICAIYEAYRSLGTELLKLNLDSRIKTIKDSRLKSKINLLLEAKSKVKKLDASKYSYNSQVFVAYINHLVKNSCYDLIRLFRKYVTNELCDGEREQFKGNYIALDSRVVTSFIDSKLQNSLTDVDKLAQEVYKIKDGLDHDLGKNRK